MPTPLPRWTARCFAGPVFATRRDSRAERLADGVVHLLGLTLGVGACGVLAASVPAEAGTARMLALLVYAAGLLGMLGCSALYNMAEEGRRRAFLQRLDHSAIFTMIAGTYTPVAGIGIGGTWGLGLLGLVWTGALGGAALKLLAPARVERVSLLLYLLLGWCGIAAFDPLMRSLSAWDMTMLLAGGLLYSLGVLLHVADGLRFHTAAWHACVLAAAACHFGVVLDLARATTPS